MVVILFETGIIMGRNLGIFFFAKLINMCIISPLRLCKSIIINRHYRSYAASTFKKFLPLCIALGEVRHNSRIES